MCELNRAEYAVRLSDVYMYRYLTAYLWALPAELHPPASIRFIAPSERLSASLEAVSACGAPFSRARALLCLHLRAFRQRVCAGDEEEDDESDDRKR